jgi:uncharacterized repeat protein (TIGR03803 family)
VVLVSALSPFGAKAEAAARATADTYSTVNGVLVTTPANGVLANDRSTIGGATLTATLLTQPAHGTIIFNTDGTFAYFANVGYAGSDSFSYRASDGTTGTQTATVTITTPVRVNDDNYATSGTTPLTVAAPGVLANDKTTAGTLTVAVVTPPAFGTLTLNSNGGFTYTPGGTFATDPIHGFVGTDSFTYRATAGSVSATATVRITNSFAIVHSLLPSPIDANTYPESMVPMGGLVRGPDSKFYGTTNGDGGLDGGNIFRIEADNSLTIIKKFTIPSGLDQPGDTGFYPSDPGSFLTGLMRGRDGSLYGTTESGGDYNQGTIYKLTFPAGSTTPTFQTLHSFNCAAGEGLDPWGVLVEGPDGALYGTNGLDNAYPTNGCWGSIVFKINKDGSAFTRLGSFDDELVGFYQLGPAVIGRDGTVYGTSKFSHGGGTVFKLTPGSSVPTILHQFDPNAGDGAMPSSGLIRGIDGALYGTTQFASVDQSGASTNGGTIFRITEDGQFATLYWFDPTTGGLYEPEPSLRRGGDGRLYGATFSGGTYGSGGLFEFDLPAIYAGPSAGSTGRLIPIHDFNPDVDGAFPYGLLGVGSDRHIYGGNASGGAGGGGVLFGPLEVNVANNAPVANVSYTAPDPRTHETTYSPAVIEPTSANGAVVTLSSIGSSDEDFDPLTFTWTQARAASFTSTFTSQQPGGLNYSTARGTFPIGTTPVTLVVDDAQPHPGLPAIADFRKMTINVTVKHTLPPVVTVTATGLGGTLEATSAGGASATYSVTAVDLVDGTEPASSIHCSPASGSMFPIGISTVTCTSANSAGNVGTGTLQIKVQAKSSSEPNCAAAAASPSIVWPPNHQFVPITLGGATSADGSPVTYTVTGIFQDEPTDGLGDGDTAIDGVVVMGIPFVRAERSGNLNGRVYHIKFTATANRLSCYGDVAVGVPHDMGQGRTPVDDGPRYDSTKASLTAVDDIASTLTGLPTTINVLANDNDPLFLPMSVVAVTAPAHGTAGFNGNGTITYTPTSGFTGTDTFTYTVRDALGNTDSATVTVTVSKHSNGDGCDHDRKVNGHRKGDGCDHDRDR